VFAETVGMNLARLRRAAGINQEALGFRADVHRTAVSLLERGEEIPGSDTLFKLSMALGVSPSELFKGLSREPPKYGAYSAGRVVRSAVDHAERMSDPPTARDRPDAVISRRLKREGRTSSAIVSAPVRGRLQLGR
jgi:transcriptional regulator with XRE-family HTH domain